MQVEKSIIFISSDDLVKWQGSHNASLTSKEPVVLEEATTQSGERKITKKTYGLFVTYVDKEVE